MENYNNLDIDQLLQQSNLKSYQNDGSLCLGVEELPLDKILPNSKQPRKLFDKDSLQELANSIAQYGVIQPILVSPLGDKFQIVAGERRYRASKLAGKTTIPCIIRAFTFQQRKEIAIIENIQRKDLNPIEEAQAYKVLLEDYGYTQDQLAKKMAKSRPVITNALRLLTLPTVVIEMIESNRISVGQAKCLASLKDNNTTISYALACCDNKMSVRALETMIYNHLNPDKTPKKIKPVLTSELKDLVNNMQYVFGTKVKLVGNTNKGRIMLDYYTTEDLNRIFEVLQKLESKN